MRRFAVLFLSILFLVSAIMAGCGTASDVPSSPDIAPPASDDSGDTPTGSSDNVNKDPEIITDPPDDKVINVFCASDEVYRIIMRYKELNPDFPYEIKPYSFATADVDFHVALNESLEAGGSRMPDIYCIGSGHVMEYIHGDMAMYATPYRDLGIDVESLAKEADIPRYVIDMGSNADGQVVALSYQGTGSAFIYRRSIAKTVWGTDDPEIIRDKIGPGWDRFLEAAADLKVRGYVMVSGYDDLWFPMAASAENPWIVDGKLHIDSYREAFLDLAKQFHDRGYTNNTTTWLTEWYDGMKDTGPKKVFGYFGPSWMVNYVITNNCGGKQPGEGTYGDWAVCEPPAGFFWGGFWVFVNKNSEHKEVLGDLIRWITLDSSETGLQYSWASGTFDGNGRVRDAVTSGTVMGNVPGEIDFLGGQDMFEVFDKTARLASGKNRTMYDEAIDLYWLAAAREYAEGGKTKEQVIADFKQKVKDQLDIIVE